MAERRSRDDGGQDDGRIRRPSAPPLIRQGRGPAPSDVVMEYQGYIPPSSGNRKPCRERLDDLDAERLWQDYISRRCPVVIDGLLKDDAFDGERWRDTDYLRLIAGSAMVKIEPINPISDHFGTSVQREVVSLRMFLDMLEDEEFAGKWYMTTQYVDDTDDEGGIDDDDQSDTSDDVTDNDARDESDKTSPDLSSTSSPPTSSVMTDTDQLVEGNGTQRAWKHNSFLNTVDLDLSLPPPTDALAHLFPLPTPSLMGGLVLQQCNLWMGNGTSGKSSGLHHDFHDNLYMVLSGRKRFLIWPPLAYRWLEPVGDVYRLHSNGLIEYDRADEPPLRSDGLSALEAASWLVRARQRAVIEADERAAQATGEAKVKRAKRKGKARQTTEQETAALRLHEAEVQKFLLETDSDSEADSQSAQRSTLCRSSDDSDVSVNSVQALFDYEEDDERDPSQEVDSEDEDDDAMGNDGVPADIQSRQKLARELESDVGDGSVSSSESSSHLQTGRTASVRPRKRQRRRSRDRRSSSILHIPQGMLPGGLRGSLNDPEGRYDSDDSGDMSDEEPMADPLLVALEAHGVQIQLDDDGAILLPNGQMLPGFNDIGNDEEQDDDDDGDDDGASGLESIDCADDVNVPNGQPIGVALFDEEDSEASTDKGGLLPQALPGSFAVVDGTDDDDESWPEVEEGEELLGKLARMDRKECGADTEQGNVARRDEDDDEDPASFSKIAPQALHWYFDLPDDPLCGTAAEDTEAPRVAGGATLLPRHGCPPPVEIHLEPGQMLYLPASWYHEVTSYCDPPAAEGPKGHANVHMALNYWFHPPTAVKPRVETRRRTNQAVKREAVTNGGAAGTASGTAKDESALPSAANPYLDVEVWDEIRREVHRRVDKIRRKAAAQHSKQEASGVMSVNHKRLNRR